MIRRLTLTATTRAIGAISLLLLYYITTRHLDDADTGRVFLVLTVSTVAMPLLQAGRNALLVRELPTCTVLERIKPLIGSVLRSHLVTVVPLAAIFMVTALVIGRPVGELGVIASVVVIVPTLGLLGAALQGLKRLNAAVVVINIAMPILFASALEIAAQSSVDLTRDLALFVLFPAACVAALILALGLLWLTFVFIGNDREVSGDDLPADVGPVQLIGSDLLFFWLVYVMIALNNWFPQLIFYLFATEAEYAHFSASQRVANMAQFVIIVANFAVAPYVAEAVARRRFGELENMYVQVSRVMTLIAAPVTLLMVIFAPQLLSLFGESFSGAANILRVFSLMQLFEVVTGVKNAVLNMGGKQRELFKALGTAFLVGLLSLPLLVALFGSLGFALAVAVTLVTQNILASRYVWREFGINPFHAFDRHYRPSIELPENSHA